ncbi:hypothetical protein GTA08_BOTSDO13108 [Botryosphaeria dothidea]|uniref:PD-(D/E)XK nuclease-like domain-containing protein n=1 Tax=Botryosphaeria dothidea TaxID=55169 RepID=A0A8H4J5V2_9PEZI|nr:hypothetical protein GTA08_BOTSDO13108 [Botryosphaeria dothidea]
MSSRRSYHMSTASRKAEVDAAYKLIRKEEGGRHRVAIAVVQPDSVRDLRKKCRSPWWRFWRKSPRALVTDPDRLRHILDDEELICDGQEECYLLVSDFVPEIYFRIDKRIADLVILRVACRNREVELMIDGASTFGGTRIDEWQRKKHKRQLWIDPNNVKIRVDSFDTGSSWSIPPSTNEHKAEATRYIQHMQNTPMEGDLRTVARCNRNTSDNDNNITIATTTTTTTPCAPPMAWLASRVGAWLSTIPPPSSLPTTHRPLKRRRLALADRDINAAMSSPTTPAKRPKTASAADALDDTPRPPCTVAPLAANTVLSQAGAVAQYAAALNDAPDILDVLDARPTSTAGSTSTAASAKRKRPRSPVKAMADLRLADAGIEYRDLEKRVDELPAQARQLYDDILACADGEAIIPSDISAELARASGRHHRLRPHNLRSNHNAVPREALLAELREAERVRDATLKCIEEHDAEPTWNSEVHCRILRLALEQHPVVGYKDVTTAKIWPAHLAPALGSGDLVESKMVDYAIYLCPERARIKQSIDGLLQRQPLGLQSVNQTRYDSLRHRPIAISIETKTPDASEEQAKVQLTVWASAQLNRLRMLSPGVQLLVLPLVFVSGPSWHLLFASMDPNGSLRLYGKLDMGETRSLPGLYKLLASLRRLAAWVEHDFKDWFVAGILHGMTDGVEGG